MFTPPAEQPPTGFGDDDVEGADGGVRQSGDGGYDDSAISEYDTPMRLADTPPMLVGMAPRRCHWPDTSLTSLTPTNQTPPPMPSARIACSDDDDDDDRDAGDDDDHFQSFHSPPILHRHAPLGLSNQDLARAEATAVTTDDDDDAGAGSDGAAGMEGLVKWKGVVLTPDEEFAHEAQLGLVSFV